MGSSDLATFDDGISIHEARLITEEATAALANAVTCPDVPFLVGWAYACLWNAPIGNMLGNFPNCLVVSKQTHLPSAIMHFCGAAHSAHPLPDCKATRQRLLPTIPNWVSVEYPDPIYHRYAGVMLQSEFMWPATKAYRHMQVITGKPSEGMWRRVISMLDKSATGHKLVFRNRSDMTPRVLSLISAARNELADSKIDLTRAGMTAVAVVGYHVATRHESADISQDLLDKAYAWETSRDTEPSPCKSFWQLAEAAWVRGAFPRGTASKCTRDGQPCITVNMSALIEEVSSDMDDPVQYDVSIRSHLKNEPFLTGKRSLRRTTIVGGKHKWIATFYRQGAPSWLAAAAEKE